MFTKYDWIQDTTDQPLDSEGILQVKNWMTKSIRRNYRTDNSRNSGEDVSA
ncbi:hypothetical protein M3181_24865 [Mesobacillus maritimus]|uniref:hypothetical protein n=1 Tax=Mesobacillus maritimus TaxID=1643336 RepID=UPI0020401C9D|nr:hypothetical protein [Mesobacillus maritimus]MCM3672116.1 hypothetical protein [Mesobacillus maritimus]